MYEMNRRNVLASLLLALAATAAPATFAERIPKIGYLALESIREQPSRERKAFLEALAVLGRVDGKSVQIVYRSAENEPEFLRAMCEELVREQVDVVATVGALPTLACLGVTRELPIVFLAAGDPIGIKATESLARPTRNATGVSYIVSELAGKRIEFLRLAIPQAKRVAFLWDRHNRETRIEAQGAQTEAERLGLSTVPMPIETQADLNAGLRQIARDPPEAIYVSFGAGVIARNRSAIVELGLKHRIPVISAWSFMTEAGGLLSYSPDIPTMFQRGAYYVDRILKGAQPGELPIEQARKIELVINMDTVRALGIGLPPELVLRADRLVE